jgi:hypothetical protein
MREHLVAGALKTGGRYRKKQQKQDKHGSQADR